MSSVPAWLAAWQAKQPQPARQGVQQQRNRSSGGSKQPKPRPAVAPAAVRPDSYGFSEPTTWAFDGGVRREPVLDHDSKPPRVVRLVGWRVCMKCQKPFWSGDVQRLRMCAGCKSRTVIRKTAGDVP